MKQPDLGYADVKLDFACMHAGSLYVTTTISVVRRHLDKSLAMDTWQLAIEAVTV